MSDPYNLLLQQLGISNQLAHQLNNANNEAHKAKMAAIEAKRLKSLAGGAGGSLDEMQMGIKIRKQAQELEALKKKVDALENAIAERNDIILDWMHSNEAFKRLSKKYAKELGLSEEERIKDVDKTRLEIATEDPEQFGNTKVAKDAKNSLGIK